MDILWKSVYHQSQVNRCTAMMVASIHCHIGLDPIYLPTRADYNRDLFSSFFLVSFSLLFLFTRAQCNDSQTSKWNSCAIDASNINTYFLLDHGFGYFIRVTWMNAISIFSIDSKFKWQWRNGITKTQAHTRFCIEIDRNFWPNFLLMRLFIIIFLQANIQFQ